MKSIAVSLVVLLTAGAMLAQRAPIEKVTDPKAPALEATKLKAPAAKVAPTTSAKTTPAKKDEKKKEELPKIPGTVINRPNGTFLGLEVVGGNFKLTFYDKKHKPMAVDVTRARARWPNPRSPGDNHTVLNGSGTALVGAKPVVPPFNFNVYLTLLVGEGEGEEAKAVENYTVAFKG